MKLLVVFHMAEVFDKGLAKNLIDILKSLGPIDCRIRGITGYTAVLDAKLNEIIKFEDKPISQLIAETSCDGAILASYSSNPEKFHAYCWLVTKHINDKPIIEIEFSSKSVIPLNDLSRQLAKTLADYLGFNLTERRTYQDNIWSDGKRIYRRILAAEPGDFVLVNGIVIGKVNSHEAILIEENGKLIDATGISLKPHGIEKLERLGFKGLKYSKVSSIKVLRRKIDERARIGCSKGHGIALFDHEVTGIHSKAREIEGAITIGDDTTLIISDILERYGKRIIGVMDGDADGLLEFSKLPSNSILLLVDKDDEAGSIIRRELFGDRNIVEASFDHISSRVVDLLKPRTRIIVRLR